MKTEFVLGNRASVKHITSDHTQLQIKLKIQNKKHKYVFRNLENVYPGDVILLKHDKDVELRFSGGQSKVQVEFIREGLLKLYISDPCKLKIRVAGKPRSELILHIHEPELPDNPFTSSRLLGLLLPQLLIEDSMLRRTDTPIDRHFRAADLIKRYGCNYLSWSPIMPWNKFTTGEIYNRVADRRFDLDSFSNSYRLILRTWHWHLARVGICSIMKVLEMISIKGGRQFMFERHPWFVDNNTSDFIPEGRHKFLDYDLLSPHHWIHLSWQAGQPPLLRQYQEKYLAFVQSLIPRPLRDRFPIIPFLEGTSKRVELSMFPLIDNDFLVGSNLSYLYENLPKIDDIKNDGPWNEYFDSIMLIKQHHWFPDNNTHDMMSWAKDIAEWKNLVVLGSNDGYKDRKTGDRPTALENLASWDMGVTTLGKLFKGFECKLLDIQHADSIMPDIVSGIGDLTI